MIMTTPSRGEDYFTAEELEGVSIDTPTLELVSSGLKNIAVNYAVDVDTEAASASRIQRAKMMGKREGRAEAIEEVSQMLAHLFEAARR